MESEFKNIYIFWHIFAPIGRETRLEQILSRQFDLLESSNLLNSCNKVFIGLIGHATTPTLTEILYHPKVIIVKYVDQANEEITTSKIREFALKSTSNARVLYIHSRGITHDSDELNGPAEDWTKMMEFFLIERWQKAYEVLENYYTAGCEMWADEEIYHYSGNFWWATTDYIKQLPDPMKDVPDRYMVSEKWILRLADKQIPKEKFYVLHRTTKHKYGRGMIHSYVDMYPREMYSLGLELPNEPIDPWECNGEWE
jgi:hypothetical protein